MTLHVAHILHYSSLAVLGVFLVEVRPMWSGGAEGGGGVVRTLGCKQVSNKTVALNNARYHIIDYFISSRKPLWA